MRDPNLLLYTGLQTDADPTTWDYHDDFSNVNSFVVFNFDTAANAYMAQIDVAGRIYQEEPSLNLVNIPPGTVVNDWYFIIITTDLMRHSMELKGSDYGWQTGVLNNTDVTKKSFEVKAFKNTLFINEQDTFNVEVYDLLGNLVIKQVLQNTDTGIKLPVLQPQIFYVIRIANSNGQQVIKHYYL